MVTLVLCAGCATTKSLDSIDQALPTPHFAKGWAMEGAPKVYGKDDIFDHIDGEAEMYFPYGFKAAAVTTYVSKTSADLSLTADVYEMGSLLDAFGIYSNYRHADAEFLEIGVEGFGDDMQLLFYQDTYFVRLAAFGDKSLTRPALLECAQAISKRIPRPTGAPPELRLLQSDCTVYESSKYVAQSLLGYPFFPKGIIVDTRLADERTPRAFIVLADTPEAAQEAFERYAAYLAEKGAKFERVKAAGESKTDRILATDPLYKGLVIQQSGSHVFGVCNLSDPANGVPLLEKLIIGPSSWANDIIIINRGKH